MTEYHKEQAELRYSIDGYICQKCGKPLTGQGDGLAHRMSKSILHLKLYRETVINHNCNLVPACCKCNASFLIDGKPLKKHKLVELIKDKRNSKFKSSEITDFLNGDIEL